MNNPFKLEKLFKKTESMVPKNLMLALLATLTISTTSFGKDKRETVRSIEKKIESFSPDHRKDFVKNLYLKFDGGFNPASEEERGSVYAEPKTGEEVEISYANGELDLDPETYPRARTVSFTKRIASLTVTPEMEKDTTPGMGKPLIAGALKREMKKFFLDDSKMSHYILFKGDRDEKKDEESGPGKALVPEKSVGPNGDTTYLYRDAIDSTASDKAQMAAEIYFTDIDGDGDVDVMSVAIGPDMDEDSYMDDAGAGIVNFILLDRKEWEEKYKERPASFDKPTKKAVQEIRRQVTQQGAVFIEDKSDRDRINAKFAEIMALLDHNPDEENPLLFTENQ